MNRWRSGSERLTGAGPERLTGAGPERLTGAGPERLTGAGSERLTGAFSRPLRRPAGSWIESTNGALGATSSDLRGEVARVGGSWDPHGALATDPAVTVRWDHLGTTAADTVPRDSSPCPGRFGAR